MLCDIVCFVVDSDVMDIVYIGQVYLLGGCVFVVCRYNILVIVLI